MKQMFANQDANYNFHLKASNLKMGYANTTYYIASH